MNIYTVHLLISLPSVLIPNSRISELLLHTMDIGNRFLDGLHGVLVTASYSSKENVLRIRSSEFFSAWWNWTEGWCKRDRSSSRDFCKVKDCRFSFRRPNSLSPHHFWNLFHSSEVLQEVGLAPEYLSWRTISQGNLDLVLAVAEMWESWVLVLSASAERLLCCAELNKCRGREARKFFISPQIPQ